MKIVQRLCCINLPGWVKLPQNWMTLHTKYRNLTSIPKGFSLILVEEKRIFVSIPSFLHIYCMHNTGNVSISSTFNITITLTTAEMHSWTYHISLQTLSWIPLVILCAASPVDVSASLLSSTTTWFNYNIYTILE